jgi:AmiR/NasT family two-component response regulator
MERQKRVLVANRPKLMREIVIEACAGQADIEIVGEVAEDSDIMSRIDETQPDFLFIALEDPEKRPPICDAILRLRPKLGIIAVGAHSNHTVKYWATFNIHRSVIEASEEAILGVIRGSAKPTMDVS